MTTRRIATQSQQLLSARATFSCTYIQFCKQHSISITSFYKQKAIVRQQTGALELPSTIPTTQVIAIIKGVATAKECRDKIDEFFSQTLRRWVIYWWAELMINFRC